MLFLFFLSFSLNCLYNTRVFWFLCVRTWTVYDSCAKEKRFIDDTKPQKCLNGVNEKAQNMKHICAECEKPFLQQKKKNQLAVCVCVCLLTYLVDFNCDRLNFFPLLLAFKHLTAPKNLLPLLYFCQQVKNTFPRVLPTIKFAGNQAQWTKHFIRCCWYIFFFLCNMQWNVCNCVLL